MAGEWQHLMFDEVIELIGGGTPKTSVPAYWGGNIPWLSVADFNNGFRWVGATAKSVTDRGLSESATELLNKGDIIISARGTVGAVAQLAQPMAFNQSCYGIRGKNGVAETDFIYYALRYAVSRMKQVAHGGVFDTITRNTFKIIEVDLPPLPEQRAIAHFLGTLDDKIELNRRMNETLEEMARALFKSWFVDFDPVRAKAGLPSPPGRGAGGEGSRLPKHIADLFPDSFEDSELGQIPKGWRVASLGDVALNPRRGIDSDEIDPATPYIALEHMPRRCISLAEWGIAVGLKSNKYKFNEGEILFGKLRPYFHKVGIAPLNGVCSTDIVVIAPEEKKWFGFILGHVSSSTFVNYTDAGATGTKMPRTKWSDMSNYRVVLPPVAIAEEFSKRIKPLTVRIICSINESRNLAALRDTLLPKLISGEVRVRA